MSSFLWQFECFHPSIDGRQISQIPRSFNWLVDMFYLIIQWRRIHQWRWRTVVKIQQPVCVCVLARSLLFPVGAPLLIVKSAQPVLLTRFLVEKCCSGELPAHHHHLEEESLLNFCHIYLPFCATGSHHLLGCLQPLANVGPTLSWRLSFIY